MSCPRRSDYLTVDGVLSAGTPHPPQAVPLPPLGKANCGKLLSLAENLCHRKRTNKPAAGKCRNSGGLRSSPAMNLLPCGMTGGPRSRLRARVTKVCVANLDTCVINAIRSRNDGRTKALPYDGVIRRTCDGDISSNYGGSKAPPHGGAIHRTRGGELPPTVGLRLYR